MEIQSGHSELSIISQVSVKWGSTVVSMLHTILKLKNWEWPRDEANRSWNNTDIIIWKENRHLCFSSKVWYI